LPAVTRAFRAARAFERVNGALKKRTEASEAALIGDIHSAIELITEAIERDFSPSEDEEDDDHKETESEIDNNLEIENERRSILPVFLQVQLLVDR
jgi:hypothetical protein